MSTFGCDVCGRQLATEGLRDKHQARCEAAAYDHIAIDKARHEARLYACTNCGMVHLFESDQIRCDESYALRDQAFAVWQQDQILEQMERQRR